MTKSDLVTQLSQAIGPKNAKSECRLVLDILFSSIIEALRQGDSIAIRVSGPFKIRDRKARVGQNPRTGETVAIPVRRVPAFSPSGLFCNRVGQGNSKIRRH